MLNAKRKARHDQRCAEMRRNASADRRTSAWRVANSQLQLDFRRDEQRRERNGLERAGRVLDREERAMAAERRYNAFHAIRTSWPAIMDAAKYVLAPEGAPRRRAEDVLAFPRPAPLIPPLRRAA